MTHLLCPYKYVDFQSSRPCLWQSQEDDKYRGRSALAEFLDLTDTKDELPLLHGIYHKSALVADVVAGFDPKKRFMLQSQIPPETLAQAKAKFTAYDKVCRCPFLGLLTLLGCVHDFLRAAFVC